MSEPDLECFGSDAVRTPFHSAPRKYCELTRDRGLKDWEIQPVRECHDEGHRPRASRRPTLASVQRGSRSFRRFENVETVSGRAGMRQDREEGKNIPTNAGLLFLAVTTTAHYPGRSHVRPVIAIHQPSTVMPMARSLPGPYRNSSMGLRHFSPSTFLSREKSRDGSALTCRLPAGGVARSGRNVCDSPRLHQAR